MTSEDLRSELERTPFRSLRLHLVSGKTVEIRYPNAAWMLQNAVMVFHNPTQKPRDDDSYDVIALRNIERVEQVLGI